MKGTKILALSACAALAYASVDVILPEGKGKDSVEAACTECHTADRIVRQTLTIDQWRGTIREMVENGAALNPEEWEPVAAYLAKNFGPGRPKVNVNKDSAKEISAGLLWTTAEAEAIVAYRLTNGAFKELKDLEKVPGLDAKQLAEQKDRITF